MKRIQMRWAGLGGPARIGLICAGLGILLALVGIARGNVPLNPISVGLALVISGGSWGVVSWAVATAVADVERDLTDAADADESQ